MNRHIVFVVAAPSPARLIRACMGQDAVEAAKCGEGNPLVILGVEIKLGAVGATFKPSDDKMAKWCEACLRLRVRALRELH